MNNDDRKVFPSSLLVCSLLPMSRDLLAPVLNVGMVEEGLQHVEVAHKDLIHACLPKKIYEIEDKACIDVLLTVICTWITRIMLLQF